MLERIYMLHARAQSGKDTCAAIMKEEYEKRGKRVIIIAFAENFNTIQLIFRILPSRGHGKEGYVAEQM